VWDEPRLLELIREQFEIPLAGICAADLLDARDATATLDNRAVTTRRAFRIRARANACSTAARAATIMKFGFRAGEGCLASHSS
jgi:hypothetical protein